MNTRNTHPPALNIQHGGQCRAIGSAMLDGGCLVLLNIQFTACVGGGFAPKRLLAGGEPLFSQTTGATALAVIRWDN